MICRVCKELKKPWEFHYASGRFRKECIPCRQELIRLSKAKNKDKYLGPKPDACEICKRKDKPLQRDHDHATGVWRGWICSPCNLGLARFYDNIESLQAAIEYLSRKRD
jgi:hypothetical protein